MHLRLVVPLAAFACLAATCEPPRTLQPIGDAATAKQDARLLGTWAGRLHDGGEFTLSVVPHEGGPLVDVVLVAADGAKGAMVLSYEGFSTTVGTQSFLSLRPKRYADEFGEKTEVGERYVLARYALSKAGLLTLDLALDDEAFRGAADSGVLEGREVNGIFVLSSSSAALTSFVTKTPGAFRSWATLRRVKLDPPKAR
ncbi:MAG: hypothetical protein JNG84_00485 [Archangium sp.]|nr:hypothetical protein [Archangium sp.]